MTQRILLDTVHGLKVSKPGYDVTTETADENLIVDGSRHGLGMYLTGQASVPPNALTTINYANPYGSIPYVLIQYARASDAIGGGCFFHTETTSYLEDTIPPSRVYETNIASDSIGLDYWHTSTAIKVRNCDPSTRTFRYAVFFAVAASGSGGGYDTTPDAMDWSNISGAAGVELPTNVQTVGGIGGPIGVGISVSPAIPANQTLRFKVNGSIASTISAGGTSASATIQNGDQIAFSMFGTAAYSATATVSNTTTGATLDTFAINATAGANYIVSADWPNQSTTTNSGGSTYVVTNSTATIGGTLNQTVSLRVTSSRTLGSGEVVQVYRNGDLIASFGGGSSFVDFTAVKNDVVNFTHGKFAGSTPLTTFTIGNQTAGGGQGTIDTYTSQLTDTYVSGPDYTADPLSVAPDYLEVFTYNNQAISWFGANEGYYPAISGINQPITLRIDTSATIPSGVLFYLAKNNASYIISGMTGTTSATATATVSLGDNIDFRCTKSTNGVFQCTVYLYNHTTGDLLDSFAVYLSKSNGPPV